MVAVKLQLKTVHFQNTVSGLFHFLVVPLLFHSRLVLFDSLPAGLFSFLPPSFSFACRCGRSGPFCLIIMAAPPSLSLFTSQLFLAWDFVQIMTCTLRCKTFVIICKYMWSQYTACTVVNKLQNVVNISLR